MPSLDLTFHAVDEPVPGERWQALFDTMWPAYRRWYLRAGDRARPPYADCVRMLRTHMPELVPTYERLVDLAGGGDLTARMLSLYDPPPYLSGCSQGVMLAPSPLLVRNYDYAPERLEGVILHTQWTGRRVIGMSDCLWGLLDGMNDAGLAVSLTFGGRRVLGHGFGIPLIVRYLLEVCESVESAVETLRRLPYQLSHTLTLVDASGASATAYLSPDRVAVLENHPVATNHQGKVHWTEHALMTQTVERERRIAGLLGDITTEPQEFVNSFLQPPLYSTTYSRGFGTLYTAAYRPAEGQVEYLWPGSSWKHSFEFFAAGVRGVELYEQAIA
jgi:predicted choloylglycine hydrolase